MRLPSSVSASSGRRFACVAFSPLRYSNWYRSSSPTSTGRTVTREYGLSRRGFDRTARVSPSSMTRLSSIPIASQAMKGVILAGGSGTRLYPLTRITNKHLLPLYDRPMVTYAIEALVEAGITELMLVTGGTHAGEFFRLLGNGHAYGIDRLFYAYQERPGGIAEALGLAQRFGEGDRVCVMLADNVLAASLADPAKNFAAQDRGARILLSPIAEPQHLRHLGVPELN